MFFLFLEIGLWILLAGLWGLLIGWWIWGRERSRSEEAANARHYKHQLEQCEARCATYKAASQAARKAVAVTDAAAASAVQSNTSPEPVNADIAPDTEPSDLEVVNKVYNREEVTGWATAPVVRQQQAVDVVRDEWRPKALEAADGVPDDLKRIKGIGPVIERMLHRLGIFHFRQIAAFTDENIRWVEHYIAFPGRINREDWLGQAAKMADAGNTEFSERYQRKKH